MRGCRRLPGQRTKPFGVCWGTGIIAAIDGLRGVVPLQRSLATLAALIFVAWTVLAQQPAAPDISGFSAETANAERQREQKFSSSISTENIGTYEKLLSARPHHVGSAYDKQDQEWIASKFKQWGWDVHVESFQILFPTPK